MQEPEQSDLWNKVTGRARYIEDLPDLPGTVYAVPIRSSLAHARIGSIDASKALKLPGVLGILDRDHLDGLDPELTRSGHAENVGPTINQHFLTTDKVRFHGDLVGMVAATDLVIASRASKMVSIEYDELPTIGSVGEALATDAPLIHEDLGTNLAYQDSFEWGDVESALSKASKVFEVSFFTPNAFHHPMEPVGSCIASYGEEEVVLWLPTNRPFNAVYQISELFEINPKRVRVRVPDVGGGFGSKDLTPSAMSALVLSRRLKRPVRVVGEHADSFRATARHAATYHARVSANLDGTLNALDVNLEIDTGAYFYGANVVTRNMCISAWGCYRIPNFRARARTAYTNKVPAAFFRATGKTQTTFGIECLLDHIASELGIDPIDIRRRNVLRRGESIAPSWRVRGTEYAADIPPIDTDFEDMIDKVTGAIGWGGRSISTSTGHGLIARGRGLALSLRHGSQGGGRTYAMATVDGRGVVQISHAAPDLGGGVAHMIATVAARTLGIPLDRVNVEEPDTNHDLNFEGSTAQRTTVHMGNAVKSACEALGRELIAVATQVWGGSPEMWRLQHGAIIGRGQRRSFGEVASAFSKASSFDGQMVLKGLGSYSYAPSADQAFGGLDHWSPGAVAVEIEIELQTGAIRVLQLAAAADAGCVLHAGGARGQVEGGAIMGLGLALNEETIYTDGHMDNANAFHYRLPIMRDVPAKFDTSIIENGDGPGPFGAKGIAQTSIPCVTPAISNAFLNATGKQLNSPPFTPEKVLRALGRLPGEE